MENDTLGKVVETKRSYKSVKQGYRVARRATINRSNSRTNVQYFSLEQTRTIFNDRAFHSFVVFRNVRSPYVREVFQCSS